MPTTPKRRTRADAEPAPLRDLLNAAMERTGHTPNSLAPVVAALIAQRKAALGRPYRNTCTPDTIRGWLRRDAVPARADRAAVAAALVIPLDDVMAAADAQAEQIRIARAEGARP